LRLFKLNIVNVTAITASSDGQFVVLATSDSIADEQNKNEIFVRVYSIDRTIIRKSIINEYGDSEVRNTVNKPMFFNEFKMSDIGRYLLTKYLPIS